ncbi:hypothetical protein RAA17_20120 [Komagataeibacter rhaeticus]|nr:hypothetical protein [Komagataeibacter rhaeticus]
MPMDHATPQPDRGCRPARGGMPPLVVFRVGTRRYGLTRGAGGARMHAGARTVAAGGGNAPYIGLFPAGCGHGGGA